MEGEAGEGTRTRSVGGAHPRGPTCQAAMRHSSFRPHHALGLRTQGANESQARRASPEGMRRRSCAQRLHGPQPAGCGGGAGGPAAARDHSRDLAGGPLSAAISSGVGPHHGRMEFPVGTGCALRVREAPPYASSQSPERRRSTARVPTVERLIQRDTKARAAATASQALTASWLLPWPPSSRQSSSGSHPQRESPRAP